MPRLSAAARPAVRFCERGGVGLPVAMKHVDPRLEIHTLPRPGCNSHLRSILQGFPTGTYHRYRCRRGLPIPAPAEMPSRWLGGGGNGPVGGGGRRGSDVVGPTRLGGWPTRAACRPTPELLLLVRGG